MTKGTSLRLDRRMFINERPERIYMALSTDGILGRTQMDHLWLKSAMGVMTIGALNQPLRNSVVKGLLECRIYVSVALRTQGWFLRLQQGGLRLWLVNAVAVSATYKTLPMRTPRKVRVITHMAREALLVYFFRRSFCEPEECIRATAAFNMRS